MKTYTVKQIAQMLDTNPETVRRWIRDDKLKAVQISRKDGNVVSEDELKHFLRTVPKYLSKFNVRRTFFPPAAEVAAVAGGIIANLLWDYSKRKNERGVRVKLEDFKNYLKENIDTLSNKIIQKEELIKQTKAEIADIRQQIERYTYLLNNDNVIEETISTFDANTQKEDA